MSQNPSPLATTDAERWRAVAARDAALDGAFVYAVASTGVFCRPSCPSRRPRRDRVRFFDDAPAAIAAGFRACRRCRPESPALADPERRIVEAVCKAIAAAEEAIPTLDALAAAAGVSPHHLQRVFTRATGLSPRRYAEARRRERFTAGLRNGVPVTAALYDAGYGSSSRLYEKADAHLGMTPASYAKGGAGATIAFSLAASPLGRLLVAATERGVCAVCLGDDDDALEVELRRDFPAAEIRRDDGALSAHLSAVLGHLDGRLGRLDLPLDVRATAFQWQVWRALAAIPRGETRSYGAIAADLGRPAAARAVGRACGLNPVAVVIPCHRAVGGDGGLTGYRWGVERKRRLLDLEKSKKAKAAR